MLAYRTLNIKPRGARHMPYKLKAILIQHGLKQPDWCAAIHQYNSLKLSMSAGNSILNWGIWPRATSKESIMQQTEDFLRSHGVDDALIATCWDADDKANVLGGAVAEIRRTKTALKAKEAAPENDDEDINWEPEMLSPNAKKHFLLFKTPFPRELEGPEDVFVSPDINYVRESMYDKAKNGGILAVIGESGSGKSTLRKDLLVRLEKSNQPIRVIFPRIVDKKRMNGGGICEAIIRDLLPDSKMPASLEGKSRLVERLLSNSSAGGNKNLIIIEEAHDLSIESMKLFKRFSEFEDGFKRLLSIIMIGQPELSGKLNESDYPEAREFIRRCEVVHLLPLGRNVKPYLKFKFERAGKDLMDIFAEDAFDAIEYSLSRNVRGSRTITLSNPLMCENLITKAMNIAADIGEAKITAEIIGQI